MLHPAAAAKSLRELSTPPSSVFLLLPAVRIPSSFSKVRSRWRMIKPRREPLDRWAGTGTRFCFRPEKAPHCRSITRTYGHGRMAWRLLALVSGGWRISQRYEERQVSPYSDLKDWHDFRSRKEVPSQEKSIATHLPLTYLSYREQKSDGQCLGKWKVVIDRSSLESIRSWPQCRCGSRHFPYIR